MRMLNDFIEFFILVNGYIFTVGTALFLIVKFKNIIKREWKSKDNEDV